MATRNKGGRPPLTKGKKCHLIQICVDDEQLRFLREKLQNSHYRCMAYLIRDMLFKRRIKITVENANARELQLELSKIGANINQSAKCCNVETIGGKPATLNFADKGIINQAILTIEKALKNKLL